MYVWIAFLDFFFPYALTNSVVDARNACYSVILQKVSSGVRDRWDCDFLQEELSNS
jgi:hypothetical protein